MSVTSLSAISADIGDCTAGKVRNAGDTVGILLSGSLPGTWTTYLDLTATGSNPVLKHPLFQLNANGGVTSYRYRCRVTKSANQTITTGSNDELTWNTEDYDVGGLHDNATNNTRITIPTGGDTGVWIFCAYVRFASNATGYRNVQFAKNGGGGFVAADNQNAVNGAETYMTLSYVENAPTAGDYFEVRSFQNSGGNIDVHSSSWFSATHLW